MPSFETLVYQMGQYAPFIAIVAAVFLAAEALFLTVTRQRRAAGQINSRLRVLSRELDHHATLLQMRRARGLTAHGGYRLPLAFFSRLAVQSGMSLRLERLLVIMAAAGLATA